MKKSSTPKTVTAKQVKTIKAVDQPLARKPWYSGTALWLKAVLFIFAFILYGNTMKNGY